MTGALAQVGRRVPKKDAAAKVTGAARYLQDLDHPGLLHGVILRARTAPVHIRRVDASAARSMPGVRCVITGADVAAVRFGFARDRAPLAGEVARCVGEGLAAIAADTPAQARAAAAAIQVETEPLPGVFDAAAALADGAPQVHAGRANEFTCYAYDHGDVDAAFARCDVVVERAFELPSHVPGPLAPGGCTAAFDSDGRLTVWAPNQVPFLLAKDLADALGLPGSRIRVVQPTIGGSFGMGLDTHAVDVVAVLLARGSGRPVRVMLESGLERAPGGARRPTVARGRMGATRDGALQAVDVSFRSDIGAYASWGVGTPVFQLETIAALYRIPSARMRAALAYTHNRPTGALRGSGNPQATFVVEALLEAVARQLGRDPLAVRRAHANRPDSVTPQGLRITSCGHDDCLREAAARVDWEAPRPRGRGVGIASAIGLGGGARIHRSDGCGSIVRVDDFGQVTLITGATEVGQGSDTALAMIVAEELGVDAGDVSVINSDTAVKPWDVGGQGSRSTFVGGNSARRAARQARDKLFACAAELLGVGADELEARGGRVRVRGAPERSLAIDECVRKLHFRPGGAAVVGEAFYDPPSETVDRRYRGNVSMAYGFAAQAAEVDVDEATGRITVRRIVAVHDAGRVINPLGAEGQVEGGIAQGIAFALAGERLRACDEPGAPSFRDVGLASTLEVPRAEVAFVETVDPHGPFGAKGIGELGLVPTAAAIAAAIHDAVGFGPTRLPVAPEDVRRALRERDAATAADDE